MFVTRRTFEAAVRQGLVFANDTSRFVDGTVVRVVWIGCDQALEVWTAWIVDENADVGFVVHVILRPRSKFYASRGSSRQSERTTA